MLHFGYYKPRLAALSILRQPSSGCLWLKWKPIEDREWNEKKKEVHKQKWTSSNGGRSHHHHQSSMLSCLSQLSTTISLVTSQPSFSSSTMFYKNIALCDTRLSFIAGFHTFHSPKRVITTLLLWSSNNIVPSLILLQTSWYSLLATSLMTT